jgi:propanol-preferring alcohol dehydrogenase
MLDGMRAVLLRTPRTPLELVEVAEPPLEPEQVRVAVRACGVCRTDLHVFDGELPGPKVPLILGHQIVGTVIERGSSAGSFALGQRVGIPWLAWTDGTCEQCRAGRENLCVAGRFNGYTVDGGYAERAVADARFCFPLPEGSTTSTPRRCSVQGMIGYRALRLAGPGERIGFYGFGSSAHLLAPVVVAQGRERTPSPGTGCTGPGLRPGAGSGVGWWLRGAAPVRSMRRSSSPRWASWWCGRWRRWPLAGRWCAPAST